MRHDTRPVDAAPLGELLGDAAGHAQGVIRTEVRLAIAQLRQEIDAALRRVTLLGGAIVFALFGLIGLLIASAMALSLVMAAWLAVLVTAGAALAVAATMYVVGRKSGRDL